MKPIITRRQSPALMVRIAWFIGIWAASVAALGIVAYALHKIILG